MAGRSDGARDAQQAGAGGRHQPPAAVLSGLGVRVERDLGGHANRYWLVRRRHRRLVLRAYDTAPIGETGYELTVQQRLHDLGWPTSLPEGEPVTVGRRSWGLFTWLPGASRVAAATRADQRRRGHLLARLHADLQALAPLGQRRGCRRAEAVVDDPDLGAALRAYERLFPYEGRVLRWHRDRARERFAQVDLHDRPLIVLHGDFIEQNLLYDGDRLTGIVDFEATHLNHRASEFALAWRGRHDAVVDAYDEVHPLDELDRALLTAALWSWVFLGVAEEIRRMLAGVVEPHRFAWQIRILQRRSPLMGEDREPYRDPRR